MVTLSSQAFRRKATRPNPLTPITHSISDSLPLHSQQAAQTNSNNTDINNPESTDNTEGITLIFARIDPDTHELIILWDDVLQAFPDAQCIHHNGVLVPFLVDKVFNLRQPKRISHIPGVVFDVVKSDNGALPPVQQPSPSIQSEDKESVDKEMTEVQEQDMAMSGVLSDTDNEELAEMKQGDATSGTRTPCGDDETLTSIIANRTTLVTRGFNIPSRENSPNQPVGTPRSQAPHGVVSDFVEVVDVLPIYQSYGNPDDEQELREQETNRVIADIASATVSVVPPSTFTGSTRSRGSTKAEGSQCHIKLVMSNPSYDMHGDFEWPLSTIFPERDDSQHKLLNIPKRMVRAVLHLLYGSLDWDRHLLPRLFIVLPNEWDFQSTGAVQDAQLVLHFLCECGPHTVTPSRDQPKDHFIHRTSHSGYVIKEPEVFFRKYGPYVLTMLYAVKVDHVLGGYSGSNRINPVNENTSQIYKMVDAMIHYLHMNSKEFSITDSLDSFDETCQLDLATLSTYLESVRGQFRNQMVQSLNGGFNDTSRTLNVALPTPESALAFYAVLKRSAIAVYQVFLGLGWDPSFYDLIELADGISSTSVVDLTIDGSFVQKDIPQYLERGTRFEAITAMITNNLSKFCSLKLTGFPDYFLREQIIPSELLSTVTEIDVQLPSSFAPETIQEIFEQMILPYSVLKKMTLNGPSVESSSRVFIYNKIKVSTLVLQGCGSTLSLQMNSFQSPIAAWTVPSLANVNKADVSGISERQVAQLISEESAPVLYANIMLSELLFRYSWLNKLDLVCDLKDFETTLRHVSVLMKSRKTNHGVASFNSDGSFPVTPWTFLENEEVGGCTMNNTDDNPVQLPSKAISWECILRTPNREPWKVRLQSSTGEFGRCESKVLLKRRPNVDLCSFLSAFGWSVQSLVTNEHWSDDEAFSLLSSIQKVGSAALRHLELNPKSLTQEGVRHMQDLIDLAKPSLKRFSLQITCLHLDSVSWNATELLNKYNRIVNELRLSGRQPTVWFPKISEHVWSHLDVPLLEKLILEFEEDELDEDEDEVDTTNDNSNSKINEADILSETVAEWLKQMIRLPPVGSRDSMTSRRRSSAGHVHPLRSLELISVHLTTKGWNEFVEAIDLKVLTRISLEETNISCSQISKLAGLLPRENPREEPQTSKDMARNSIESMRQLFTSLGIDPSVHSKHGQIESSSSAASSLTKAKVVLTGSCGNLEAYVHTTRQKEARRRLAARMEDKDCRIKFTVLWRSEGEELALVTVERH
ncbi:hypothetical protein BGW38_004047 [Lunasporangiospora selenospora]|uniref:Uncharacterized protein n=1 Tax=Lunasporangiospora selenospora TaxID=979761 RepID=A0A9P6KCE9_9FUNG|nr:hypothetical protein BGW38_004047 [Lunasporangiospora selenospora]